MIVIHCYTLLLLYITDNNKGTQTSLPVRSAERAEVRAYDSRQGVALSDGSPSVLESRKRQEARNRKSKPLPLSDNRNQSEYARGDGKQARKQAQIDALPVLDRTQGIFQKALLLTSSGVPPIIITRGKYSGRNKENAMASGFL